MINLQLADNPTEKDYLPLSVENGLHWRSKEAKQRTNTRFGLPDQARKRIGGCGRKHGEKGGNGVKKEGE